MQEMHKYSITKTNMCIFFYCSNIMNISFLLRDYDWTGNANICLRTSELLLFYLTQFGLVKYFIANHDMLLARLKH